MPLPDAPDETADAKDLTTGFTLVEIAIVIVIIGTLVGGILVGRDLIEAARIRAQASQIEQYRTAIGTFRAKYDALPGDMPPTKASAFGFAAGDGTAYYGDNNGKIETGGSPTISYGRKLSHETALFWAQLSQAQLINGNFSMVDGTVAANNIVLSSSLTIDQFVPTAKIGNGNYVAVFSYNYAPFGVSSPHNYFLIAGLSTTDATGNFYNASANITTEQAYAIDAKTDDGIPFKGKTQPIGIVKTGMGITDFYTNMGMATGSGAGTGQISGKACVDFTGSYPYVYDLGKSTSSAPNCQLIIAF